MMLQNTVWCNAFNVFWTSTTVNKYNFSQHVFVSDQTTQFCAFCAKKGDHKFQILDKTLITSDDIYNNRREFPSDRLQKPEEKERYLQ